MHHKVLFLQTSRKLPALKKYDGSLQSIDVFHFSESQSDSVFQPLRHRLNNRPPNKNKKTTNPRSMEVAAWKIPGIHSNPMMGSLTGWLRKAMEKPTSE